MLTSGLEEAVHRDTSENGRIGRFTLFIGANASGKSTILDALRFLGEAMSTDSRRKLR